MHKDEKEPSYARHQAGRASEGWPSRASATEGEDERPIGRISRLGKHSAKAECMEPGCNWSAVETRGHEPHEAVKAVTARLHEHHLSAHAEPRTVRYGAEPAKAPGQVAAAEEASRSAGPRVRHGAYPSAQYS